MICQKAGFVQGSGMAIEALETLRQLVRFPSVSADSAFAPGMRDVTAFLAERLRHTGFEVELIPTAGHPMLIGERKQSPGAPTILLYAHYDVQPADPLALWKQDPFELTLSNGRAYGRGAADNKGPIAVMLAAISTLFEAHPQLPLNLIWIIEGEEEIGSPSFQAVLESRKAQLQADFLLACDTGSQQADQLVVTAGLRGITCLEVKAKGPRKDLHSGIYGGAVRNPIRALMQLCAQLHGPDGRIAVPGFYDGYDAPQAWERGQLTQMGFSESAMQSFLGVDALDAHEGMTPFESTRFAPTIEFNGIQGGYQGEGSKTIIPSEASVKISCRLVPNQDPEKVQEAVIRFLAERCPPGIQLEFERGHSGRAYRVLPGNPGQSPVLSRAFELTRTLSSTVFGKPAVFIREGGSIPVIQSIRETLGIDSLLPGLYLPEDGYHAPNESFSLEMMEKGQRFLEQLLQGLATPPDRQP
jgi:acetylornithine deacetylase/succinyl-diaminopimelate desuccinylase-like protein